MGIFKKSDGDTITLRGVTYNLVFNLNVVEAVIGRFGSVAEMYQKIEEMTEQEALDVFAWITVQIINEDVAERRENGENLQAMTIERLKRTMSARQLVDVKHCIIGIVRRDMPTEENEDETESDGKN
jgi:glutamyl-tRNA reductase|nr:MAG TPA: tail assembly chaperone protein [Caudoviricetes sp.]